MKKILVTGSMGRLGRAVCEVAKDRYDVVAFDLVETDVEGVQPVVGDVRDLDALKKAAKGCDAIVHTAALLDRFIGKRPRSEFFEINVAGTDNVFQTAVELGIPKVVQSSSTEVYGTAWEELGARIIKEDDPVHPKTIYGLTKYLAEGVAHSYARYQGIKVACLRYQTFNDKPRETMKLGLVARYLWVNDVAEANLACVESDRFEDDVFLIGPLTPLGYIDVVEAVYNPEAVLERYWPGCVELLKKANIPIKQNALYPVVSISKAQRLLDWTPTYTFGDWLEWLKSTLEK